MIKSPTGVIRFKEGEFKASEIKNLGEKYGKFGFAYNGGVCFSNEIGYALPEYLISEHKIDSGSVIIIHDSEEFEINQVTNGFVEETEYLTLTEFKDWSKYGSGQRIIYTDNTRILHANGLTESLTDSGLIIVTDIEVPSTFEYVITEAIQPRKRGVLPYLGILLIAGIIAWFAWPEPTPEPIKVKKVDHFKDYYSTLYGKLPSVRQQLSLAYDFI
ncbi:MAG: hypothetical protein HAW67_06820, partial [Endozoicomonadaceae bacterium]|nr:hypothetical protein [Endozoicomonadaceae bacterium]